MSLFLFYDSNDEFNKVKPKSLYVSKETYKHIYNGEIVMDDLYIGNIHIFNIPSSHSKGCLGFEINNEYAFVGDALYSGTKDGDRFYNAQILNEEIKVLSKLKAPYFLVSHYKGFVKSKDEAIIELKEIYSKRTKDSPLIRINTDNI